MKRDLLLVPALVMLATTLAGADAQVVPHELIPKDPKDDIAMGVVMEGDIPAALETRSGVVSAPDPRRPTTDHDVALPSNLAGGQAAPMSDTYTADRDTRRPDVLPYEDPFVPSTAPFKRLVAFDAVDAKFGLFVRDPTFATMVTGETPRTGDDAFYADVPLDYAPSRHVRIPSVGPGTRVVRATLTTTGGAPVSFHLLHDGADNWFLQTSEVGRGRLVLQLTIPRATFGGEIADVPWESLLKIPAVPANIAQAAQTVAAHIGVSKTMRPREVLGKMVTYFRSFADSDDPPRGADIYTDLALSQKGVCRHRAFAFTVTALALDIPTRMVLNESHAWVEVHDGVMWRRIDLGGAGRLLAEPTPQSVPYAAPPDVFSWPAGATRGQDLTQPSVNGPPSPSPSGSSSSSTSTPSPSTTSSSASTPTPTVVPSADPRDKRPHATLSLHTGEPNALRGTTIHVTGDAHAEGDVCAHMPIEIVLRDATSGRDIRVGSVATDAKGAFSAALVLPTTLPLGDYTVIARTEGDTHCGRGQSD